MLSAHGLLRHLVGIVLFCAISGNCAGAEPWRPPWARTEAFGPLKPVEQTGEPFVFRACRFRNFDSKAEAETWAAQQRDVVGIVPVNSKHKVLYADMLDLAPIVPEQEKDFWKTPMAQYALWGALRRHYQVHSAVQDGALTTYATVSYRSEEEAEADARDWGRPVAKQWVDFHGSRVLEVRYCKFVDLLPDARRNLECLELAFKHLLPEHVPPYEAIGPNSPQPIQSEGVLVPGQMQQMGYTLAGRPGQGATVMVFLAESDHGLDHDYLRHFMLTVGADVVRRQTGQVVAASADREVFTWKAGPRAYYRVVGGRDVILDAYLKTFPSVLPTDYRIDKTAWLREEVRRTVERLKVSAAPEDKNERYLWDYLYLCRFIEPVPGAPPLPPAQAVIEPALRAYHFSVVSKWWESHVKDFRLRDGAPLSHAQVYFTLTDEKLEAILQALRQAAQKEGAAPGAGR